VRSKNVDPRFSSFVKEKTHKTSASIAWEIGLYTIQKLKNHNHEVQYLMIIKLLEQPMLKGMVPPFLKDLAVVKLEYEVLGSFIDGMQAHLVGLQKSKSFLAKNIVTTFVVALGIGSQRDVKFLSRS